MGSKILKRENVPEALKALEAKISKVRQGQENGVNEKTQGRYSSIRIGMQIATDLLAAVIVGAGIGWVLDYVFNTKPIMLIVFLLFGGAAGFVNVYRTVKFEEKRSK